MSIFNSRSNKLKYDNPEHVVSKRYIDFKALERLALQYGNSKDAAE